MPRPETVEASQLLNEIPSRRFSTSSNARVIERSLAAIDAESRAVATLFPRQVTPSVHRASKILFGHPMIFGLYVAFNDEPDPIAELIAMLTAIANSASNEWKSTTPVEKLNIAMGAVQITLTSQVAITWDAVSAIAIKLTALVKKGVDGFFGAVTWYSPGPGTGLVAIGIGLGLATLALGTAAYAGAALYMVNEMNSQVAAALPAINLMAPPVPAAQVLGETMLRCYGLAAPAA